MLGDPTVGGQNVEAEFQNNLMEIEEKSSARSSSKSEGQNFEGWHEGHTRVSKDFASAVVYNEVVDKVQRYINYAAYVFMFAFFLVFTAISASGGILYFASFGALRDLKGDMRTELARARHEVDEKLQQVGRESDDKLAKYDHDLTRRASELEKVLESDLRQKLQDEVSESKGELLGIAEREVKDQAPAIIKERAEEISSGLTERMQSELGQEQKRVLLGLQVAEQQILSSMDQFLDVDVKRKAAEIADAQLLEYTRNIKQIGGMTNERIVGLLEKEMERHDSNVRLTIESEIQRFMQPVIDDWRDEFRKDFLERAGRLEADIIDEANRAAEPDSADMTSLYNIIVGTFHNQQDAQRALLYFKGRPLLDEDELQQLGVCGPSKRGLYVVAFVRALQKEIAQTLKEKAIGANFPEDIYLRRIKQGKTDALC